MNEKTTRAHLIGLEDAATRRQALEQLIAAKDEALPLLRRLLDHGDEAVRAAGAAGLHRLQAPEALEAALATLHDQPDLLHLEMTPAVQILVDLGAAALPFLFPLLLHDDEWTRRRAQTALERISYNLVRGASEAGDEGAHQRWQDLWQQNGAYSWRNGRAGRVSAVNRWRSWHETAPPEMTTS